MPLNLAQRNAWNLARTLMTIIVVFRIGDRNFGVAEANDFDGDRSHHPNMTLLRADRRG